MISVIIPAYNSAATLPACLKALANQTLPPDEVIVIDDSSQDVASATLLALGDQYTDYQVSLSEVTGGLGFWIMLD